MKDANNKSPKNEGDAVSGISFEELREGLCKFPLGGIKEPPERFCGEPTQSGMPYCPKCRLKAYNRVERRK